MKIRRKTRPRHNISLMRIGIRFNYFFFMEYVQLRYMLTIFSSFSMAEFDFDLSFLPLAKAAD